MFIVFPDPAHIAHYVSQIYIQRIQNNPEIVLGLATGGTMEPLYKQLIKYAQKANLDVSRVSTFNLDEYAGLAPDHPQSYAAYMQQHLFKHLPFNPENLHIPDGLSNNLEQSAQAYSELIRQQGGIALQLLGVGGNGHIGFNEPGTPFDSRCHLVELSEQTRIDNSRFFAEDEMVPAYAVTMGMLDILEAQEILLIATGANKADTLANYYQHGITPDIPFTALKQHPKASIILDEAAAAKLPASVCQRPQVSIAA